MLARSDTAPGKQGSYWQADLGCEDLPHSSCRLLCHQGISKAAGCVEDCLTPGLHRKRSLLSWIHWLGLHLPTSSAFAHITACGVGLAQNGFHH